MINPIAIGEGFFVFRGFPANIKTATHNPNLINIVFHKDSKNNFEPAEDLLTTTCYKNSTMGEIANQCKNRFVVVICKEETKEKNGRTYRNMMIKHITIMPQNAYNNEYTKEKAEENQTTKGYLSDEELNEMPF